MDAALEQHRGDCHVGHSADRTRRHEACPAAKQLASLPDAPVTIGEEIVEPEVEGHRAQRGDCLAPCEVRACEQQEQIEDRHVDQHAERADGTEQGETRRYELAEGLVVETC